MSSPEGGDKSPLSSSVPRGQLRTGGILGQGSDGEKTPSPAKRSPSTGLRHGDPGGDKENLPPPDFASSDVDDGCGQSQAEEPETQSSQQDEEKKIHDGNEGIKMLEHGGDEATKETTPTESEDTEKARDQKHDHTGSQPPLDKSDEIGESSGIARPETREERAATEERAAEATSGQGTAGQATASASSGEAVSHSTQQADLQSTQQAVTVSERMGQAGKQEEVKVSGKVREEPDAGQRSRPGLSDQTTSQEHRPHASHLEPSVLAPPTGSSERDTQVERKKQVTTDPKSSHKRSEVPATPDLAEKPCPERRTTGAEVCPAIPPARQERAGLGLKKTGLTSGPGKAKPTSEVTHVHTGLDNVQRVPEDSGDIPTHKCDSRETWTGQASHSVRGKKSTVSAASSPEASPQPSDSRTSETTRPSGQRTAPHSRPSGTGETARQDKELKVHDARMGGSSSASSCPPQDDSPRKQGGASRRSQGQVAPWKDDGMAVAEDRPSPRAERTLKRAARDYYKVNRQKMQMIKSSPDLIEDARLLKMLFHPDGDKIPETPKVSCWNTLLGRLKKILPSIEKSVVGTERRLKKRAISTLTLLVEKMNSLENARLERAMTELASHRGLDDLLTLLLSCDHDNDECVACLSSAAVLFHWMCCARTTIRPPQKWPQLGFVLDVLGQLMNDTKRTACPEIRKHGVNGILVLLQVDDEDRLHEYLSCIFESLCVTRLWYVLLDLCTLCHISIMDALCSVFSRLAALDIERLKKTFTDGIVLVNWALYHSRWGPSDPRMRRHSAAILCVLSQMAKTACILTGKEMTSDIVLQLMMSPELELRLCGVRAFTNLCYYFPYIANFSEKSNMAKPFLQRLINYVANVDNPTILRVNAAYALWRFTFCVDGTWVMVTWKWAAIRRLILTERKCGRVISCLLACAYRIVKTLPIRERDELWRTIGSLATRDHGNKRVLFCVFANMLLERFRPADEAACQGALEAAFQTIMAARNATHTSILTQAFRFLNAVIAREPTYVEDAFTERVCDRIVYIGLTTRDRQLEWRAGAVLYRMLKARRRQTERIPEWLEQRASGSIILLVERFLKSSDPRLHLVALLLVCQLCTAFVGRARGIGFNLLDKTKDLIIQMKAESPSMSLRQLAADIIARYLRLLVPEGCRVQHTIPEILNVQAPEERLAEKPVDIHLEWASDTIARTRRSERKKQEREARELMIHVIANFDMSGEMRKKIQVTERRRACAKELPEAEAVRTLWGRLRNDQVESMDRDLRCKMGFKVFCLDCLASAMGARLHQVEQGWLRMDGMCDIVLHETNRLALRIVKDELCRNYSRSVCIRAQDLVRRRRRLRRPTPAVEVTEAPVFRHDTDSDATDHFDDDPDEGGACGGASRGRHDGRGDRKDRSGSRRRGDHSESKKDYGSEGQKGMGRKREAIAGPETEGRMTDKQGVIPHGTTQTQQLLNAGEVSGKPRSPQIQPNNQVLPSSKAASPGTNAYKLTEQQGEHQLAQANLSQVASIRRRYEAAAETSQVENAEKKNLQRPELKAEPLMSENTQKSGPGFSGPRPDKEPVHTKGQAKANGIGTGPMEKAKSERADHDGLPSKRMVLETDLPVNTAGMEKDGNGSAERGNRTLKPGEASSSAPGLPDNKPKTLSGENHSLYQAGGVKRPSTRGDTFPVIGRSALQHERHPADGSQITWLEPRQTQQQLQYAVDRKQDLPVGRARPKSDGSEEKGDGSTLDKVGPKTNARIRARDDLSAKLAHKEDVVQEEDLKEKTSLSNHKATGQFGDRSGHKETRASDKNADQNMGEPSGRYAEKSFGQPDDSRDGDAADSQTRGAAPKRSSQNPENPLARDALQDNEKIPSATEKHRKTPAKDFRDAQPKKKAKLLSGLLAPRRSQKLEASKVLDERRARESDQHTSPSQAAEGTRDGENSQTAPQGKRTKKKHKFLTNLLSPERAESADSKIPKKKKHLPFGRRSKADQQPGDEKDGIAATIQ